MLLERCNAVSTRSPPQDGRLTRRWRVALMGHENAEGMAYVGVRVEPPVRLPAFKN